MKTILGYTRSRDDGSIMNYHPIPVANTIHGSTGGGGNTDQVVLITNRTATGGNTPLIVDGTDLSPQVELRKLTPRECFRLMDVDESNIDKIMSTGLSDSRLFRLSGNSICCCVLENIFRQLLTDDLDEVKEPTLF